MKNLIAGLLCSSLLLTLPVQAQETPADPEIPEVLDTLLSNDWEFNGHLTTHLGYQGVQLQELNPLLQEKGYAAIPENAFAIGGGLQLIFNRFLTELEGQVSLMAPSSNERYWSSLSVGQFMLNLGYQIRPVPNLSIYPVVGAGVNVVDLTFSQRNIQPSFSEFLDSPGRQGAIYNVLFALNLGVGVDWTWDWGGLLGLRAGVVLNPFASNWWNLNDLTRDEEPNIPLTQAPAIRVNGPYLRLVAGF